MLGKFPFAMLSGGKGAAGNDFDLKAHHKVLGFQRRPHAWMLAVNGARLNGYIASKGGINMPVLS